MDVNFKQIGKTRQLYEVLKEAQNKIGASFHMQNVRFWYQKNFRKLKGLKVVDQLCAEPKHTVTICFFSPHARLISKVSLE